ncbi:MAG: hypothetical protein P8163_18310 [Candidatus Thiodiazotropha sp.]
MDNFLSASSAGIRSQIPVGFAKPGHPSQSNVADLVNKITQRLDQRGLFNDVTHRELREINDILASLPPSKTQEVIAHLSDDSLKTWADEIDSSGLFGNGGLNVDERTELFSNLASQLDVAQLGRLYQAFESSALRSELADSVGRSMETDEVQAALNQRAEVLPNSTQRETLLIHVQGLERLQHADQMARFAADVYEDFDQAAAPNTLLPGTRRLNPDRLPAELGISRNDLIDDSSGYYAAIYQQGQGDQAGYIVAFRGTENGADWLTNLGSGVGFKMTQFKKADLLMAKLTESVGTERVECAGHSLGGGLSNYVGMKHSVSSTAFNPKGTTWRERLELHGEHKLANKFVQNYQVDSEVLTGVQEIADPVIMKALGPVIKLPAIRPDNQEGHMLWETLVEGAQLISPFHDASHHDISDPIDRHGMDYVRRGVDAKTEQSEAEALKMLFDSFE